MDGLFLGHIPCSLFATVKSLRNVVNYRSRCLGLLCESLIEYAVRSGDGANLAKNLPVNLAIKQNAGLPYS